VDALALWNSRLERVDVNPAYERMFGFSRDEVLAGAPARDLPADDDRRRKEIIARTLAGEQCQEEVETMRRNGECFQAEVRTIPIQHRGEMHVLAMVRDVTRRRRAESALRESEARLRASEKRYRLLFEMESDAILVTDADTLDLLDANRAAEELWGYSRDELMRMKATDLSAEKEATRIALQGDAGTIAVPLRRHRKKDGSEFTVEITLNRFVLDGRRIVISAIRDITGRQLEERRRAELEAQLRQAQKMEAIGHLTGGIAHDFNNLLTSIMGYVTLAAERSAGSDAKLAGYLEQAEHGCGRARDLIQQMLTFSRGGRGDPRALTLAPLVRESVKLLRSSLPATVALQTVLDDDVSPVLVDTVQLEQVLMNLAINARDAMRSSGEIRITVRRAEPVKAVCASCRANIAGDLVELAVADNGSGIRPEVQERMFEPFFTTKEVGRGSGMGLSSVHGIVHEHGGHIVVESEPGNGATFRVLLPALQMRHGVPAHSPQSTTGRRLPSATLAGRVAVVDDEASVACFMQDLLAHWGLAVTTFANAREALGALDTSAAFDLVITDQTMPGMTGLEFARAARALRPGLQVVLYTGYGETIAPAEIERAGIVALVRKPVVPSELLALVAARLPLAAQASRA
jgi:PAS domain S-box-containing protein